MSYSVCTKTAVTLAKQGGEIIRTRFGGSFTSAYKSCPSDLVTEVDRKVEDLILNGLRANFPEHTIFSEENRHPEEFFRDGYTWHVDPLDGTTNFVYGIPFCAVSIALAYDGQVIMGVVYDPFRRECFSSTRGSRTHMNGKPVRVDRTRKTLGESLLVTGYPANKAFNNRLLRVNYHYLLERCANLRALGSAALELAYVACGRLTGFWEDPLMPWDVAAGSLLVEEAGGSVTDIDGNNFQLDRNLSIAATNGLVHDELLAALRLDKS
jgi:myo-inositol-1(or 4)-monophosphatase